MKVDAQKEAELRALQAQLGTLGKFGQQIVKEGRILAQTQDVVVVHVLVEEHNALPLLLDDLDRLRLVLRETRDAVKFAVDHVLPEGAVRDDFAQVQRKAELALGDET